MSQTPSHPGLSFAAKNVITIDGPAASGKGTLASRMALHLQYAYIDTGALYRIVAKAAQNEGIAFDDKKGVAVIAENLKNKIQIDMFTDPSLRASEISNGASIVAANQKVREFLFDTQRFLAENPPSFDGQTPSKGAVLDGRDTGTVVYPEATLKFFVTADVKIRAQRRLKELQLRGFRGTYDAVLQDMVERDERDAGRVNAPMKPADDAIIVDTSDLSADEAFEKLLSHVPSERSQSTM